MRRTSSYEHAKEGIAIRYAWQVRRKPDGRPVSGAGLRLRDLRDRSIIATIAADRDGVATYETDGHLVPFSVETVDTPGGIRLWRSDAAMAQGVLSPMELPLLFDAIGEGAIAGLEVDVGEATIGSGPQKHTVVRLSLTEGTALVGGIPVVCRNGPKFDLDRPTSATRIDRLVARIHPAGASETPGFTEFAMLTGVEGGGTPSLTQTSDVREIGLYAIPVPVSGPVVPEDERPALFEGVLYHYAVTQAVFHLASASASSPTTILSETVALDAPGGYTYEVGASAYQVNEDGLVLTDGFGSKGSGNGQFNAISFLALRDDGDAWVADVGNNRVQRITLDPGTYVSKLAINGISGVAVNPSNNHLLTLSTAGLYNRWNASGGHAVTDVDLGNGTWQGIACDGTYAYAVRSSVNRIYKRDLDGVAVTNWGGTGSGDGQLNGPAGIATDGTYVWVTETTNLRISMFTVAGVFVRRWAVPATPRAIAVSDDTLWVASSTDKAIRSYDFTGALLVEEVLPHGSPMGIAADADTVWVADRFGDVINTYVPATSGYGVLTVAIDGFNDFSSATGSSIGDRSGTIDVAGWNPNGPGGSALLTLQASPESGTMQLRNIVAWFRAIPLR